MGKKVTFEDDFKFVKLMMERDLGNHSSDRERLDYLMLVVDYATDVLRQIRGASDPKIIADKLIDDNLVTPSKKFDADLIGPGSHEIPLGEDRPELEDSDIDVAGLLRKAFPDAAVIDMTKYGPLDGDPVVEKLSLISSLFELTRPPGLDCKNPMEFFGSGTCLKGEKAKQWLYERKSVHNYEHIHVFDDDYCLVLPDMDSVDNGDVIWIDETSIKSQGPLGQVMKEMFYAYSEGRKERMK